MKDKPLAAMEVQCGCYTTGIKACRKTIYAGTGLKVS